MNRNTKCKREGKGGGSSTHLQPHTRNVDIFGPFLFHELQWEAGWVGGMSTSLHYMFLFLLLPLHMHGGIIFSSTAGVHALFPFHFPSLADLPISNY